MQSGCCAQHPCTESPLANFLNVWDVCLRYAAPAGCSSAGLTTGCPSLEVAGYLAFLIIIDDIGGMAIDVKPDGRAHLVIDGDVDEFGFDHDI